MKVWSTLLISKNESFSLTLYTILYLLVMVLCNMAFLKKYNAYICKKVLQYVKKLFLEKCYTCSAKNYGTTWNELSKDYYYYYYFHSFNATWRDLPHNAISAGLLFFGYTNKLSQDLFQQQWIQAMYQHMSNSGCGWRGLSEPSVGSAGVSQLEEPTPLKSHLPLMKEQPFFERLFNQWLSTTS